MKIKFTGKDAIAAIQKNGYPWTKGDLFNYREGSSCVLGQMVRNLVPELYKDIPYQSAAYFRHDDAAWAIVRSIPHYERIYRFNDANADNYEQAANIAVMVLQPYIDKEFELDVELSTD